MAKRTSSLEELLDATAAVPWWVGVALAGASYLLLSWVAGVDWFARPGAGVDTGGMVSALVAVFAEYGRVGLPVVFVGVAVVSGVRRWRLARSAKAGEPHGFRVPPDQVRGFGLSATRNDGGNGPTGPAPQRASNPDISQWSLALIQAVEWLRLEELAAAYFGQLGFRARMPAVGIDGGAEGGGDIQLYWEDAATPGIVVRCKAWRREPVGVEALRALLEAMGASNIAEGVFVASGGFTPEARAFCAGRNMHLIDGADLLAKIGQLADAQQQALLALATQGDFLTPSCPTCRIKMLFRQGKAQDSGFWGCANFPRCRNKLYSAREAQAG
ncbi:MAG: restriction endonuclease [Betaproteobacteria bacterium]